jgi:hypothetical protein
MSELGYLICQDLDICLVEGFLGFLLEAMSLNGCMFLLLNCNKRFDFPNSGKGCYLWRFTHDDSSLGAVS